MPETPTIIGPSGTKKQADGDICVLGPNDLGPLSLSVPPGEASSPTSAGNYGRIWCIKVTKKPLKTMT